MENQLRVTLKDLEISPGKRAKNSNDKSAKRSKLTEQNVEQNNFIIASKQVIQTAHIDTLKRLKLLNSPKCSICMNTSTKLNITAMSSLVVTIFNNEMRLSAWYDALETCFYWITPTQYLPENVLRDIVEIMLNAHNDITTPYTIEHIINRCQQILAYNFNMHPPCKAHAALNKCYIGFLTNSMEDKKQTYSNRKKFGHSFGIVKYCFNRLEDELCNKSTDNSIYSEDFKETEYTHLYKDTRKETQHRLNWEEQTFEIYEMLNRGERINRLIAVLHSVVELMQMNMYFFVSSSARQTYLQMLNNKDNDLRKLIMKVFVYSIHLDYPEGHIKVLNLWLNMFVQIIYFNSDYAYTLTSREITKFEDDFYKIMSELPHQSIVKILNKIEPPCIKYLMCRRHCNKILSVTDDSVISIIINFINSSRWLQFPESHADFNPTTLIKDMQQTDLLNQLSYICKNVNHKIIKYESDEITQNEVIHILYISLEALLEAYYVKEIYNKSKQSNIEDNMTLHVNSIYELEIRYREIYQYQEKITGLLQSVELPKCLECFKNILRYAF